MPCTWNTVSFRQASFPVHHAGVADRPRRLRLVPTDRAGAEIGVLEIGALEIGALEVGALDVTRRSAPVRRRTAVSSRSANSRKLSSEKMHPACRR